MELKRYQVYYWIHQVECSDVTILAENITKAIYSCELWIKRNYKGCLFEIMEAKLIDKTVDVDRNR